MIDTVVLESPFLDKEVALNIESKAIARQGIEIETGDIFYTIVTRELKGTFDSSLRVKIEWERFESFLDDKGNTINKKVPCEPYLIVECSLNKLFLGHNVFGGSDDFKQFELLVLFLSSEFAVTLPSWHNWVIRRLDYALNFNLGDFNTRRYIVNLSNSYFSRRKVKKFDDTGLYFAGSTTTLKLYHKGAEFKKFDSKRLRHFLKPSKLKEIQNIANNILRVEVEIKPRKIKYDNEKLLKIWEYYYLALDPIEYFRNVYKIEVAKLIKLINDDDNKYYLKYDDVKNKLFKEYTQKKANILLGTWLKFSLEGEESAKKTITKSTFYRHRKELIENNCNWNNNLIERDEKEDNVLLDFYPSIDSKYCFNDNNKLEELYNEYKVS